jgi:hypothetical protein
MAKLAALRSKSRISVMISAIPRVLDLRSLAGPWFRPLLTLE